MLPRLDHQSLVSPIYQEYAQSLAKTSYSGEINFKYSARLAVATDNSVYQQLPQLVLHPKSVADVVEINRLASEDKYQEIKFSARGGGTGTNGQSLTELGNQPLGRLFFHSESDIAGDTNPRESIEIGYVSSEHELLNGEAFPDTSGQALFVRRSTFLYQELPALVQEVFLPAHPVYQG